MTAAGAQRRVTRACAARAAIVIGLLALGGGLTACGAPPPQVPVALANTVSSSLSSIAETCGEAYQESAPGATAPTLAPLERRAVGAGTALVGIERRNPGWIYQGDTLQQIVALAVRRLLECRLARAAGQIESQTH